MKQQTRNHFIFTVILITLFWGLVPAVHAQTPFPSDNEVNQIASKLYCPVCENIPLDVCGTTACAEWRELIRQKLAEGWTEEQINDYFVQQYGERVLAVPPRRGFNWLFYVLPPVIFLVGLGIVIGILRKNRKTALAAIPVVEPENDPYVKKMEETLRQHGE